MAQRRREQLRACRQHHSAPCIYSIVYPADALRIEAGEDRLKVTKLHQDHGGKGVLARTSCVECSQPLFNRLPFPVIAVFPWLFASFELKPEYHLFHQEAVLPLESLQDGVPRLEKFTAPSVSSALKSGP